MEWCTGSCHGVCSSCHVSIPVLQAIFLIPNSDPPTLPTPNTFSPLFHDFLRVCLVKQPDLRPTATQLFEHPFIATAKSKSVIQALVDECMGEIDEYRQQEAAEQQQQQATAGNVAHGGTAHANATMGFQPGFVGAGAHSTGTYDPSTMLSTGTSSFDTGTMINHATSTGTMLHHGLSAASPTGTLISLSNNHHNNNTYGTTAFTDGTMRAAHGTINTHGTIINTEAGATQNSQAK